MLLLQSQLCQIQCLIIIQHCGEKGSQISREIPQKKLENSKEMLIQLLFLNDAFEEFKQMSDE